MTIDKQPSGVLDIGSYQLKLIIFKINNSKIEILSKIILKTEGINKGVISDLNKFTKLINELIGKAEDIAGIKIKKLYLSLSPILCSILSFCNSKNIGGYPVEHEKDLQFLINDSVNLFKSFNLNSHIIHLFNFNLRTDKTNYIENPIGLIADTLESDSLIVYSKKNILLNFINLFQNINIKLEKFVYAPFALGLLAHSESPLSDMIMVIDFGHNKTSLSIFKRSHFIFSSTISVGSWHVTNDIAKSLNLNFDIAEDLKKKHSFCQIKDNKKFYEYYENENFGFKSYKRVSNNILNKIVNSRVEEIIEFLNRELINFRGLNQNFNKIVLTGEGTKIRGFDELIKEKLIIKSLVIEKLSSKIKCTIEDEFDVCLSLVNYIKNSYVQEVASVYKYKKTLFQKLYSLFN